MGRVVPRLDELHFRSLAEFYFLFLNRANLRFASADRACRSFAHTLKNLR